MVREQPDNRRQLKLQIEGKHLLREICVGKMSKLTLSLKSGKFQSRAKATTSPGMSESVLGYEICADFLPPLVPFILISSPVQSPFLFLLWLFVLVDS